LLTWDQGYKKYGFTSNYSYRHWLTPLIKILDSKEFLLQNFPFPVRKICTDTGNWRLIVVRAVVVITHLHQYIISIITILTIPIISKEAIIRPIAIKATENLPQHIIVIMIPILPVVILFFRDAIHLWIFQIAWLIRPKVIVFLQGLIAPGVVHCKATTPRVQIIVDQ
jgi:hypothetical protein